MWTSLFFFLTPLLNSVKLALSLILWSFLDVLIEVLPLAGMGVAACFCNWITCLSRYQLLVHLPLFSYTTVEFWYLSCDIKTNKH